MANRKRRAKSFHNNKKMGSVADVNFEIFGENKQGRQNISFDAAIHYFEKGEGYPLLLVHGVGQSLYTWRKNIDFFAQKGYRVIAMDLAGFGYSSHPNIYYSVEENAQILKAFMDELKMKKASIIGFSTGALSAISLANKHPKAVDKLVLISPGGPNEFYPFPMRFLTTRLGHALFRFRFGEGVLERMMRELFFDKPLVTKDMVDQYYAPYKRKSVRDTLAMSMMHFDEKYIHSILRGIRKDTLVLSGENDPIHPPDMIEKYASNIPGTDHIMLRNCGHLVHEEKPDRANSEILMFFRRSEAQKV